jgi:hypothetical protein
MQKAIEEITGSKSTTSILPEKSVIIVGRKMNVVKLNDDRILITTDMASYVHNTKSNKQLEFKRVGKDLIALRRLQERRDELTAHNLSLSADIPLLKKTNDYLRSVLVANFGNDWHKTIGRPPKF